MESISLAGLAGTVLFFLFEYIPGFSAWYEKKDEATKRLIMLGLLVVTAVGVFLLSCYGPFDYVACAESGIWQLLELLFAAAVANQVTHSLAKKPS